MAQVLAHCLDAPAKLNISLHIEGRRNDGYHLLSSRIVLTNLCDKVTLTVRDDGEIVRLWQYDGISDDNDLSFKAAKLLKKYSNTAKGVSIVVDKKIPVGSGLGGGSSDAATVLMGLNVLWSLYLEKKILMDMALQLGADVPFFIFGECSDVSGVGEVLQAINVPQKCYLLAFPEVSSSTLNVFNCFDKLTNEQKRDRIEPFKNSDNHLSAAAVMLYPSILETAVKLKQVASHIQLSGSGSTVFASFATMALAVAAKSKLPKQMHTMVVSAMSKHPIYNWGVAKR